MRLYRHKRHFGIKGILLSVLIFAAVTAMFWFGLAQTSQKTERESQQQTQQAIRRAVVNCYAIEGSYPKDIAYLEEHYGVVIDSDRYVVLYERIGSNVMPYVEVVRQGSGGTADEID